MAKTFNMPENLDIHYKFFGGRYSIKDMGFRLVGLPLAIPAAAIIISITHNTLWGIIAGTIFLLTGFYIGSRTVYNKQINIFSAIMWSREAKRKTKILYNKRQSASDVNS
jgi:hypothetical protein